MIDANRKKPHVLLVTEKWFHGKPDCGLTNNKHNLSGSLETTGLATQEQFHPDEHFRVHNVAGDETFLDLCRTTKPDLVVISWLLIGVRAYNLSAKTLFAVRNEMKIPIVAVWCDLTAPGGFQIAEFLSPFVDLNIVWDSTTTHLNARHPECYLPMWTPQDPRFFHDFGIKRDIDISFLGSVDGYPDRSAGLSALLSQGIKVFHQGGQREHPLPVDEYARIHARSKISLNFCRLKGKLLNQVKGRVYEITLCGAMLMEAENSETAHWFEPMSEYVPFSNEADLVNKARYYLEHDDERESIAARGCRKATKRYTAEAFWKRVLQVAGQPAGAVNQTTATLRIASDLWTSKKKKKATGLLQPALLEMPKCCDPASFFEVSTPDSYLVLSEALAEDGKIKKAEDLLLQGTVIMPKSIKLILYLGRLYWKQWKLPKAGCAIISVFIQLASRLGCSMSIKKRRVPGTRRKRP